jgi:hypothetical protein
VGGDADDDHARVTTTTVIIVDKYNCWSKPFLRTISDYFYPLLLGRGAAKEVLKVILITL